MSEDMVKGKGSVGVSYKLCEHVSMQEHGEHLLPAFSWKNSIVGPAMKKHRQQRINSVTCSSEGPSQGHASSKALVTALPSHLTIYNRWILQQPRVQPNPIPCRQPHVLVRQKQPIRCVGIRAFQARHNRNVKQFLLKGDEEHQRRSCHDTNGPQRISNEAVESNNHPGSVQQLQA